VGQVLLVRHGQASFGAEDYDVLSELGWAQGRLLGARLAAEGLRPAVVLGGGMRRHRETAEAIAAGGGFEASMEVDPGWDEFDHLGVVARWLELESGQPGASASMTAFAGDRRGFQRVFEQATARWTAGEHDDYPESYAAFVARVDAALSRACALPGPAVVVSSGGPIAAACVALVTEGAAPGQDVATLWRHFNTTAVNSGVTRVLVGSTGRRLLTFNEYAHLSPETISYR